MLFAEPPKDLIRKLLVVDPKKRITINEALQHPFFQMMVRVITSSAVLCSCSPPVSSCTPDLTDFTAAAVSQIDEGLLQLSACLYNLVQYAL